MISIAITTSDMQGRSVEFLNKLYESILVQDCKDIIEVIVSDDSTNGDIKQYCSKEGIKYFHNGSRGASSINMNNAISKARGEIIKPMFCDDYFTEPDTLSKFASALETSFWAFCASKHKESGRGIHIPFPNDDLFDHDKGLAEGCNTYGCPSAMAFVRTDIQFDEKLKWLMDCDFYVRMQMAYGIPSFVDTSVNIREWEGQQTYIACDGATRIQERNYVIQKYANVSREV